MLQVLAHYLIGCVKGRDVQVVPNIVNHVHPFIIASVEGSDRQPCCPTHSEGHQARRLRTVQHISSFWDFEVALDF